ncbi:MAG: hypothetical protein AAFY17_18220, partial [Cyanobacteria bacterium J06642_11]
YAIYDHNLNVSPPSSEGCELAPLYQRPPYKNEDLNYEFFTKNCKPSDCIRERVHTLLKKVGKH